MQITGQSNFDVAAINNQLVVADNTVSQTQTGQVTKSQQSQMNVADQQRRNDTMANVDPAPSDAMNMSQQMQESQQRCRTQQSKFDQYSTNLSKNYV